ncbi:hypothetical protein DEO72_LG8g1850 [Vigna unguiculata]|uniref:Protein kinase domain-containing protein n=1 Tax=Vigna unguiculata TaxID=3917 RepID=A0A4D6MT67_VIGUN|nr:hypothetical protein DEO72_LG8g1850 [Vigna unguiculata]
MECEEHVLGFDVKDLQKATYNFTTLIGQGAFGHVYKAQMSIMETIEVKILPANSKQGEKEFYTKVKIIFFFRSFGMRRSLWGYKHVVVEPTADTIRDVYEDNPVVKLNVFVYELPKVQEQQCGRSFKDNPLFEISTC